jgi:hypothetical protein
MIPTLIFLGVLYASVSARFVFFRIFEGTRHKNYHTVIGWASWIGILAATWVLAFVIAEVIPFFADLLSLMSSLFDSFFGWIFWGVAYLRMRRAQYGPDFYKKRGLIRGWGGLVFNVFIIVTGLYFLGAGTYVSDSSPSAILIMLSCDDRLPWTASSLTITWAMSRECLAAPIILCEFCRNGLVRQRVEDTMFEGVTSPDESKIELHGIVYLRAPVLTERRATAAVEPVLGELSLIAYSLTGIPSDHFNNIVLLIETASGCDVTCSCIQRLHGCVVSRQQSHWVMVMAIIISTSPLDFSSRKLDGQRETHPRQQPESSLSPSPRPMLNLPACCFCLMISACASLTRWNSVPLRFVFFVCARESSHYVRDACSTERVRMPMPTSPALLLRFFFCASIFWLPRAMSEKEEG